MADTAVPLQQLPERKERNAYVSPPSGPRPAKETTFREWVVANQIGMKKPPHHICTRSIGNQGELDTQ